MNTNNFVAAGTLVHNRLGIGVDWCTFTGEFRILTRSTKTGLSRYSESKFPNPTFTADNFVTAVDMAHDFISKNKDAIFEADKEKLDWIPFVTK